RRSSLYPTWITRLVRPDRVRFEREVHSICVADGPVGLLREHFIHYSFNKGMQAWFDKHNRYSTVEAELAARRPPRPVRIAELFSTRAEVQRPALKALASRMPFRPMLRFFYMYVLRGGFLDGWPGYAYCRLLAAYEFMIVIKMEEQRQRQSALVADAPAVMPPLKTEAPERRMV